MNESPVSERLRQHREQRAEQEAARPLEERFAELQKYVRVAKQARVDTYNTVWEIIEDMHGQLGHVGMCEECFRPWCYELRQAVSRGT